MSENDDRALLVVGALGTAWDLNQIRKNAPRLWSALAFVCLAAVTSLLIWFSVEVWHYILTTPACQQNGTCATKPSTR